MVELDVQMTRDRRLVVFHDDRVERTTNGSGRVTHVAYRQLARLDAGRWFHPRFTGERILLLFQALRLIPAPMRVNLELKCTRTPQRLVERFIRIVRSAPVSRRRVMVSSVDARLLRRLRGTRWPLALICRRNPEESLHEVIRLRCAAWHPLLTLVTPLRIQRAHQAGLRVHVWTVDRIPQARRLVRWGVDGLFTNNPAHLIAGLQDMTR